MSKNDHCKSAGSAIRPATEEEFAALDFLPWKKDEAVSNDQFAREISHKLRILHTVACVSYRLMYMSKSEMMTEVDGWPDEIGETLMRSFFDATESLETLSTLIKGAEARILVAGSTLLQSEAHS
ncbi:MAG: hypothetical protein KDJ90_12065 [Nitratireductor sp.]|nr:hypothetical protein [Nitratireductor sp.]